MEPKAPDGASLKLELVEDVPRTVTGDDAPATEIEIGTAAPHAAPPLGDPFLAQATRERDAGQVDAALWKRALALADGDESAAVEPYLRARATVLRLAQQRRQAQGLVPVARPEPKADAPVAQQARHPLRRARPRALALAVGSVAALAVAVVAWMLLAPAPQSATSAASTPLKAAARAPAAAPAAQAAPAAPAGADAELLAKVAALREAGNWNIFVIYAAEWTRKAPQSAAAWVALSEGYVKLGQLEDAYEAAKQAVALDATNPAHLRHLALVYEALERPEEAIAAIEQALRAQNDHADSFALAGRLYVQLDRLAEARSAFDRALALDPSNSVSSCGALDVARRQGRAKDADALAKALKAADIACEPPARGAAVAVASGRDTRAAGDRTRGATTPQPR
ncbi:MAG: hypothetical protein BroJett026_14640 [Betaproteobacteria bacterium]|nr:MAG: hypothetical protein BroJett026_14640 [Betaproteobacteria bacterium]